MASSELSLKIPKITESKLINLIAKASGVSETAIQRYTNGVPSINKDAIIDIAKIANALDLSIQDIIPDESIESFSEKVLQIAEEKGIVKNTQKEDKASAGRMDRRSDDDLEISVDTSTGIRLECISYYACEIAGFSNCNRPPGC
jgi:transcriptional regulator with XRE-family HTH domain